MNPAIFVAVSAILWSVCAGDVFITDRTFENTIAEYRTVAATFGQSFPEGGIQGLAVQADPIDGCRPIKPPPSHPSATHWVAVVARYGGCNFEKKVWMATQANYSAAIVYNVGSNKLVPMAGGEDSLIPSVFMGFDDAQVLLSKYTYNQSLNLRIVVTDDHPFDINAYLLPFAIVVGICFVVMLCIVIYKCIQDFRRTRRHRLPKSALKKLPIHKFKAGDPFETCCICLDDFEENDKLRILPCDHGYHAKCIDPWLVKTKRICPQCRKRVFESNERGAGLVTASSEEGDSQSELGSPRPNADEREPLLRRSRDRFTQRERRNFRRSQRSNGTFSATTNPERLSAQERIRRAFSGRTTSVIQQEGIISSEEFLSSSDEEEPRSAAIVTANQDSITVRIEQPSSHQLVAEVHVVPRNPDDLGAAARPRSPPKSSESEVVVMPPEEERGNPGMNRRGSSHSFQSKSQTRRPRTTINKNPFSSR